MRIPCRAPRPVPTMMAAGTANPRAQGQAISSTLQVHLAICAQMIAFCQWWAVPQAYQAMAGDQGNNENRRDKHGGDLVG